MKEKRNNRLRLTMSSVKAPLITLLIMAAFCSGCTGVQERRSETPLDHLQSRPKTLTESDAKSYQHALESLDEQPERALEILVHLTRSFPNNAELKTNLALAHYRCGNYEKALKASEEATELDADIGDNDNLRGLIAMEQNRFRDAEDAFLAALEKDPQLALAHYNLGLLYDLYFQDIAQALNHYEHYLMAYPDDKNTVVWVEQLKRSLEKE